VPDQLIHIKLHGPLRRALTLLPLALALAGAWYSVRWYVGNTMAEYFNPDDRRLDVLKFATDLAPKDPLTHWQLAEAEQRLLPPDQVSQSIHEYEEAARLSPNDYRFWLALGRALEQSGDIGKAELAMRRAVELAPAYSYPRWYLGNLLVRGGRNTEAFAELRRAGEADPQLRPQVFNLALQVYGQNLDELKNAIGPSADNRAQFAKYLLDNKRIDDGLRMWNSLNAKEKIEARVTGETIMNSLLDAKRFRYALDVWNDLAPSDAARARVGHLFDGGFEENSGPSPFAWQLKSTQQAQTNLETGNSHSGARSLRLQFQAHDKADFSVLQIVVIDPGAQYELTCFFKTNKLESAGTPEVVVLDAADGAVLGTSQPAPAGDYDWQPLSISFKTAAKTEAIKIVITRAPCGEVSVCPIFGAIWYDDFALKRQG
jgi:tetratricopeptide (TPR) repeat protein